MRVSLRVAVVCGLVLLATPVSAQSTTEDGIRAMVRGDYPTAARILKPLAHDATPDPIAQFFMAVLYQSGQGIGADLSHACTLFLRSANREHPFTEQAAAISASMLEQLGAGAATLCVADERWQGGPPVPFDLGPGHRIVFADTSITIVHGDTEQRTILQLPSMAAFLPIQHTPITVTRPTRTRRDFFQWFAWTPDSEANPRSWTLTWTLIEVVNARWIVSASEPNLAVADGRTPPAPYDVTNLVRLQTNANGEAVVTIAGGLSPRTAVIPPAEGR